MTIPAERKANNIQLSINRYVRAHFVSPNSLHACYQDETLDVTNLDSWVDINFISNGAGRKGVTMVQIDLYERIRGRVSSTGDRFQNTLNDLADKLHAAFHVDGIPIYDFVNPTSPGLISGQKLMIQTSNGTFREPETDQPMDIEDGVARRSITYRMRLIQDASQAKAYYD